MKNLEKYFILLLLEIEIFFSESMLNNVLNIIFKDFQNQNLYKKVLINLMPKKLKKFQKLISPTAVNKFKKNFLYSKGHIT